MSVADNKGQAFQHQAEGTQFLRGHERAALFDEQGLGKSKQLIDAIVGEIEAGRHRRRLDRLSQWAEEHLGSRN